MQKLKFTGLSVIIALLALPTGANAESWICENGDLMRELSVEGDNGASTPCSVVYSKETENLGSKVLWTAQTDRAYCEEKANGLAEKLKGFGWACTSL